MIGGNDYSIVFVVFRCKFAVFKDGNTFFELNAGNFAVSATMRFGPQLLFISIPSEFASAISSGSAGISVALSRQYI
jgi:hypothetical protein